MKYKNFRNLHSTTFYDYAVVDECRFLRKKQVEIFKQKYSSYWKKLDTGEWLPDQVRKLEEAYRARKDRNRQ